MRTFSRVACFKGKQAKDPEADQIKGSKDIGSIQASHDSLIILRDVLQRLRRLGDQNNCSG